MTETATDLPALTGTGRDELRRLLDGPWAERRTLARELSTRELFRPQVGLSMAEQRELTYQQLMALCDRGRHRHRLPDRVRRRR